MGGRSPARRVGGQGGQLRLLLGVGTLSPPCLASPFTGFSAMQGPRTCQCLEYGGATWHPAPGTQSKAWVRGQTSGAAPAPGCKGRQRYSAPLPKTVPWPLPRPGLSEAGAALGWAGGWALTAAGEPEALARLGLSRRTGHLSQPFGCASHAPKTVTEATSLVTMTVHHVTPPYGCGHSVPHHNHPTGPVPIPM